MAQKGDFIGFTFNGRHSSDMGIVRTSNGSRYNSNLLPTMQDETVQVPGGDGTYFFGSYYTQKLIPVSIATDKLTESQYRDLSFWLGDKGIHELIFDETPYKKYMVKCTGTPNLNFICFEENGQRVYKGEGNIQFTAYYPYAKSVHKYLDEYDNENKNEWAIAAGLKEIQGSYDGTGDTINLYNPGDMEADFYAYYAVNSLNNLTSIYINSNILKFNFPADINTTDTYIRINTKTNLIEGCDEQMKPTGTLYNQFITSGDFFKIPQGESQLLSVGDVGDVICSKIEYDYIYY